MSKPKAVLLDVENEERRQDRIRSLLERLNESPSTNAPVNPPRPSILSPASCDVEPPLELLARVQAFLPAIQASNEALSQRNPVDLDIENVAEDEEQYIEMNLGLGVFEAKRRGEASTVDRLAEDDDDDDDDGSELSSRSSFSSSSSLSDSADASC